MSTNVAILIAALFTGTISGTARAQDVVPDTLDWHGYIPLAAGNEWQYYGEAWSGSIGTLERWYETWHVLADTLIDGALFFELETTCDSVYANPFFPYYTRTCYPGRRTSTLIRYDESLANVVERATVSADSTVERLWWGYDFRLDAPFGQPGEGTTFEYDYTRGNDVELPGQTVHTTTKVISVISAVPGGFRFGHGIGLLSVGFHEGGGSSMELVYAQIGGVEFGQAVRVGIAHPEAPHEQEEMDVYPNPTVGTFTLSYTLARSGRVSVLVVDVLGREVARWERGLLPSGVHQEMIDGGGLGDGLYFIVLRVNGQFLSSRALVLLK